MNFKELIETILKFKKEFDSKSITLNSKIVKKNDIFLAISKDRDKNFQNILEAISKGACLIIVEKKITIKNFPSVVYFSNIKNKLSNISNIFYDFPSKNIELYGVTGTNGKSSVSSFLHQILKKNNKKTALLTSIKSRKKGIFFSGLTTPDTFFLNDFLSKANLENYQSAIIEVSSHGIHQDRVKGLNFNYGCFTNISRDHLDYHKSMQDYSNVKESFFLNNSFDAALINIDTSLGERIKKIDKNFISFSSVKKNADFFFNKKNILFHNNDSYDLNFFDGPRFMKLNLAMAISLAKCTEFSIEPKTIKNFYSPAGRFEKRKTFKGKSCIIDYAHSPKALEIVLKSIRSFSSGNIICIFGCGGERDKGKRPNMGRIAEKFSNKLIITNDNPRLEDPNKIKEDIIKGISKVSKTHFIPDRKEAIQFGLKLLKKSKKGSTLLIAGKGHENYQEMKDKRIYFSDKNAIEEIINVS